MPGRSDNNYEVLVGSLMVPKTWVRDVRDAIDYRTVAAKIVSHDEHHSSRAPCPHRSKLAGLYHRLP